MMMPSKREEAARYCASLAWKGYVKGTRRRLGTWRRGAAGEKAFFRSASARLKIDGDEERTPRPFTRVSHGRRLKLAPRRDLSTLRRPECALLADDTRNRLFQAWKARWGTAQANLAQVCLCGC